MQTKLFFLTINLMVYFIADINQKDKITASFRVTEYKAKDIIKSIFKYVMILYVLQKRLVKIELKHYDE